jgi:hypothetical protein
MTTGNAPTVGTIPTTASMTTKDATLLGKPRMDTSKTASSVMNGFVITQGHKWY